MENKEIKQETNIVEKIYEKEIIKEVPVEVIKEVKKEVPVEIIKEITSGLYMTESKENIAKALAEYNKEMEAIAKTSTNPFFSSKYTNLSDIIDATRPILAKHGLSVIQSTIGDSQGRIGVKTTILHTSGEYITQDGILAKPENQSIQKIASSITYLKRYELSALLYISSKEEDDDGEVAMNRQQTTPTQTQPTGRIRQR